MDDLRRDFEELLRFAGEGDAAGAPLARLYAALSGAGMAAARGRWDAPRTQDATQGPLAKTACYFSAEFLLGRLIDSNLYNLGLLEQARELFAAHGLDLAMFEEVDDAALGNGGLGRLAACYLDSAATQRLRLDGYGLRYRYGLFRQSFDEGFQREEPDDWLRFGDPWSIRREEERVLVEFGEQSVWAVPYDMPVIGYGEGALVNNLRLWQAEAVEPFDFALFNEQRHCAAYQARDEAEALTACLYPNDDTDAGKRLRLKQQYLFCSASLQSILARFAALVGGGGEAAAGPATGAGSIGGESEAAPFGKPPEPAWERLPELYAVQLNDTHSAVAAPELLRLLCRAGCLPFSRALGIVKRVFAYTNHTVMAEALETWDERLFATTLPAVWPYLVMMDDALREELAAAGLPPAQRKKYALVADGRVHMARLSVYASHHINGVARIHSEILKRDVLKDWYALYPERFANVTNGITQRRWLALCNPGLAGFITKRVGSGWITGLNELASLRRYAEDSVSLVELSGVKAANKARLAAYVQRTQGFALLPNALYDVQAKRMHEYKRQLMNAFSILELYFRLKDGELKDFTPTVFLFGGKAAPGYRLAKAVIKVINETARLVNRDPAARGLLQVCYMPDYNVSKAELLLPAADVSEQISMAGTEASGTGNMKLALNGAVTLGTWDGANIEIVEAAGEENNYIFGARVEELQALAGAYDPMALYKADPRLRRVVDALVDGTLDDGDSGLFAALYRTLLRGETWRGPDHYKVLLDLPAYIDAKLQVNRGYADSEAFSRKCLLNIAACGRFSSDRAVREYAAEIWGV